MNLLLITDDKKSHCGYIKDFTRCAIRKSVKTKSTLASIDYNVLVTKEF